MRHPFASAATIAAAACLALPLAAEAQTSDVAAIQRQLETLQSTLEEQQRLLQEQAAEFNGCANRSKARPPHPRR